MGRIKGSKFDMQEYGSRRLKIGIGKGPGLDWHKEEMEMCDRFAKEMGIGRDDIFMLSNDDRRMYFCWDGCWMVENKGLSDPWGIVYNYENIRSFPIEKIRSGEIEVAKIITRQEIVNSHWRPEAKKEEVEEMEETKKSDAVLPIPCTKGIDGWTVKQWFQKINEELDELKAEVLTAGKSHINDEAAKVEIYSGAKVMMIAEEAADTITAITSMLEAIGIDEETRQEAQRRVNERNRTRGRI